MKKFLLFLTVSITALVYNQISAAEDSCSHVTESFVKSHIAVSRVEIVSKTPVNGFCQVILKLNNKLIPLYTGKDFVIAGDMYQNRKKITKEAINRIKSDNFKKNRKQLDDSVAIIYEPQKKTGPVIYMFTEPLCPYCHDAGEKIRKISDKYGATIKLVLYSVHGEKGVKKCVEAACRGFNLVEYNEIKWKTAKGSEKYQCRRGRDLVARAETISEKLGLEGVPAFFLDDGTFINGADMKKIVLALEKKKIAKAADADKRRSEN